MLRLGCSWAMGGGGFRWDCPAELRAGEWRMSACDGKNGITSLQGADMPAAYFAGADFQNVNLKYANLEYRSCGFLGNEWCLSNLNSTNCTGAQFDHAVLRGVSFRGANLKRTTFLGANLNCADFTGAFNVSEDTFRGISGDTHCFTPPDGKPGDDCAHIIRTQCPKA
jgi:uncharacterized protein YjbI with pentapeptide repeats